ncbi:MAG: preprotein translocase subunit SecE [Candidatus Vogelbacteria bacterium CG10_big_fil_rev_8_21_14_0_10_51_16]|uniref:Protein translocase subunit SecE n=1 Tax=Candidatus Vogelbacteria bacterium CG10_big_fil_rev_8_21_14_0_10_51_16 TaxID=1975045 RepID=A0A2H0RDF3_9BACT|nr:MAG: preprotein translocase subunit SecE [Candidatus Vogelbacteria bacterium CG10_big_fil_rev_8_21_14_0_10_51_16]
MSSFANYIKETRAEFKYVNWPTRRQSTNFTLLVILISAIVAFLLFAFDALFITILETFIF